MRPVRRSVEGGWASPGYGDIVYVCASPRHWLLPEKKFRVLELHCLKPRADAQGKQQCTILGLSLLHRDPQTFDLGKCPVNNVVTAKAD